MGDNYSGPTQPYNNDGPLALLRKIAAMLFSGGGVAATGSVSNGPFILPAPTGNGVIIPGRPVGSRGLLLTIPNGSIVKGFVRQAGYVPAGTEAVRTYGPYTGGDERPVALSGEDDRFFLTFASGDPSGYSYY